MSTTVLITGITGFVGRHLERECKDRGMNVLGTVMHADEARLADGSLQADRYVLSLTESGSIRSVITQTRPDVVIHLAAISFVPDSSDPTMMDKVNHQAVAELAQAMIDIIPKSHLLFVSSAEVFGRAPEKDLPFTEQSPEKPVNAYGQSKLDAEQAIRQLGSSLSWTIARPFNHIGPGQDDRFAIPAWCKQLVEIEQGKLEPIIRVGNLDVLKDFSDVRDVVRAYVDLTERREGVANQQTFVIASGKAISLGDILDRLIAVAGLTGRVTVEIDQGRFRAEAFPVLYGSAEKIHSMTGWSPRISLDDTLRDCLEDMRTRLSS